MCDLQLPRVALGMTKLDVCNQDILYPTIKLNQSKRWCAIITLVYDLIDWRHESWRHTWTRFQQSAGFICSRAFNQIITRSSIIAFAASTRVESLNRKPPWIIVVHLWLKLSLSRRLANTCSAQVARSFLNFKRNYTQRRRQRVPTADKRDESATWGGTNVIISHCCHRRWVTIVAFYSRWVNSFPCLPALRTVNFNGLVSRTQTLVSGKSRHRTDRWNLLFQFDRRFRSRPFRVVIHLHQSMWEQSLEKAAPQ